MNETTKAGFPKGRVAERLKAILKHDLTPQESDTFFVVLLTHSIVEEQLNRILYSLMHYDLPLPKGDRNVDEPTSVDFSADPRVREMQLQLWNRISSISFDNKLKLIKPSLIMWFPKTITDIKEMNTLRGQMVHLRDFENLQFRKRSLWNESTLEDLFLIAEQAIYNLQAFRELIDGNHAVYERWRDRLKELGEDLV